MEFNLKKTDIGILASVLDTVSEQPVDIDFTLPDYCPDIEKILRCRIIPKIYNRNLSGGQLQVDGTTVVNILYTDSKNNIRACEQSVPFNSSFSLKEVPDNPVIETCTKCEYLNCRPLSQRRLTVHGAFSLYAKVKKRGELRLFSPDNESGLEFNTKTIKVSNLKTLCQEQFSAGDEIQIVNKPPIEIVLDSDVLANITDYKVIPEKVMFNGELKIRMLYLSSADSGVQQADYSIPFSKTLDCADFDSDTTVSLNLSLLSYDIRLKNDILSENPVVNVDCRLSAYAEGYSSEETEIVLDAYSTEFPVELEKTRFNVISDTTVISDSFMLKDSVSVSDCAIGEIIDFNLDASLLSYAVSDGKLTLNSKLNVCILALNESREPFCVDRSIESVKEIEVEDLNSVSNADISLISVSYRIADNNVIELRAEIKYNATVANSDNYTAVCAVSANEDEKLTKRQSALVLYFADEGEKLWDIAKNFNTRKSLISAENSVENDVLTEARMLLIPIV